MNKLLNFIARRHYNLVDLCMVGIFTGLSHSKEYVTYGGVLMLYLILSIFLANINSKTKEE